MADKWILIHIGLIRHSFKRKTMAALLSYKVTYYWWHLDNTEI